jgi:DNA-binding MarR family transcriptional regulator
MDQFAVIAELERRAEISGQVALAKKLKISPQYLCDILKRRRQPGPKVLKGMGIKRAITYR